MQPADPERPQRPQAVGGADVLGEGADHRRLIPLTALLGAVYLVLVDLLSRTLTRPNELPLGILAALLGAPFFLWLLRRNKGLDTV